ncbi:MAG: hypothetical protein QM632_03505 [Micrococcaceae bacterium]
MNDNKQPMTRAELKKMKGTLSSNTVAETLTPQDVITPPASLPTEQMPTTAQSRKKVRQQIAVDPATGNLPRSGMQQALKSPQKPPVVPAQPLPQVSRRINTAVNTPQTTGANATAISQKVEAQPLQKVLAHNPYSKSYEKPQSQISTEEQPQLATAPVTTHTPMPVTTQRAVNTQNLQNFNQTSAASAQGFQAIGNPAQKAPQVVNTAEIIDTKHLEKTLQKVNNHQIESQRRAELRRDNLATETNYNTTTRATSYLALGIGAIAFILGLVAFLKSL